MYMLSLIVSYLVWYIVATVNMAKEHGDFVIGFISQSKLTSDPALIHMTPGKCSNHIDHLGGPVGRGGGWARVWGAQTRFVLGP